VERAQSSLILDGQQRLATATMVLAAARDLLHAEGRSWSKEAEDLQSDYIVGKEFQKRRSFRLDLSQRDREVFRPQGPGDGGQQSRTPLSAPINRKLSNEVFATSASSAFSAPLGAATSL
jgi:hypothetical protein